MHLALQLSYLQSLQVLLALGLGQFQGLQIFRHAIGIIHML